MIAAVKRKDTEIDAIVDERMRAEHAESVAAKRVATEAQVRAELARADELAGAVQLREDLERQHETIEKTIAERSASFSDARAKAQEAWNLLASAQLELTTTRARIAATAAKIAGLQPDPVRDLLAPGATVDQVKQAVDQVEYDPNGPFTFGVGAHPIAVRCHRLVDGITRAVKRLKAEERREVEQYIIDRERVFGTRGLQR